MSITYTEFLDSNLHRVFPLDDDMSGRDTTDALQIPTALISDIFMCAPNHPSVDLSLFYISNLTIRSRFIDITIGYDGVSDTIGSFHNIDMSAPVHTTYLFTPLKRQTGDLTALLFHMTGQITMGDLSEVGALVGSWNFDIANTLISPARLSQGILNIQYISVNDRLYTGLVRLKEGANIDLTAEEEIVAGLPRTTITVSATLNADSDSQFNNDQDVLDAITTQFGRPLRSINGVLPDIDRNFQLDGADCTDVIEIDNGLSLSNPCATPCCEEDSTIEGILESLANLNLRYGQLKAGLDAGNKEVIDVQNKLLRLASTSV